MPRRRDSKRLWLAAWAAPLALIVGTATSPAQPQPAAAQDSKPAPSDADELSRLTRQASELYAARRFSEAVPLAERAVAIIERVQGRDHPRTLAAVVDLAFLYQAAARYAEAEPLYRRALEGRERVLGRDHPHTLVSLSQLAALLQIGGRYAAAEPLYRRALEGWERLRGPDDRETLTAVNNLATIVHDQGRYAEAEPLYRRAVDGSQRVLGPDHPDTLTAINNLAFHFEDRGRHAEAEPLYRRALEGLERALGPDHPDTLTTVNNLAELYRAQGRYAEAEPLHRRGLEGGERVLGAGHPNTLRSVNNLATLYQAQGRYAEAEPLYRRVLEGSERTLGPDHPSTLTSMGNLAAIYRDLGRLSEAEPLYRRALDSGERALGADHPTTLNFAGNLALLYRDQGRYAEAEPLYRRVLDGRERTLGRDHPYTLASVNNLAALYRTQGRHEEAEPLYRRALEGSTRVLGPDHPTTLTMTEAFVVVALEHRSAAEALAVARQLATGARKRRQAGGPAQQARVQREREGSSASRRFALFADVAWTATSGDSGRQATLLPEALAALQDAVSSAADRSVAEQAARRYVGGRNPELGELMRERQRLENDWARLDGDLAVTFGGGGDDNRQETALIRDQLEAVQARIETIDGRLRNEAPDYFALVEPTALDAAAAQRLLAPDEAVILAVPSPFGTHVVAATRDGFRWHRSDWHAARVRAAVQRLRWDAGARVDGTEEELARLRSERPEAGRARFDRTTAHELYRQLVEPIAPMLADKRRIYVAAGGALAGLPFSVLVSAPPTGADDDPASLRTTRWLGDDFALIHIPSLQSLALLREAPPASGGSDGFLGVGDPVLGRDGTARGRGATRGLPAARQLFRTDRSRDGGLVADVAELRRLARLPGTARELEAVRSTLGAPPESLMLAARATEPNVRSADLSQRRIILFSTHGLTAAEAAGVGEAGLVLTPPDAPRDGDDGFLAASEVTTLRLNADWVILSACNTATGEGTDNAGLGQLARAFFYAGARNLLASHWPVSDEVAPVLIARTLALERAGTPRAEAFRQAMREIRMDASRDSTDSWAHPFYWAPFVLIGDGGR